jgi:hypothetical protein
MSKAKPAPTSIPSPTPQITFVEEDVKLLQQFGQLLVSKASLNLTIQEALLVAKYVSHMNAVTKKIEAHILEVKSLTQIKDAADANNTNK